MYNKIHWDDVDPYKANFRADIDWDDFWDADFEDDMDPDI